MENTMSGVRAFGRKPLPGLSKLVMAALVGIGLTVLYLMLTVFGGVDPMALAFSVIPLFIAAIMAMGWRWSPLLGALISGGLLAVLVPGLPSLLSQPGAPMFMPVLVILALALVGVTAGIGAAVQNYRRAPEARRVPRWLPAALALLLGFLAGAGAIAAIPQAGTAASISPESLAAMRGVTTKDFEFAEKEIRVKAGEIVALRFDNADPDVHTFDIDEFQVHTPIPVGKPGVAIFTPTKAGVYTFYCAPHSDKKTGMVGTLIVEE